jgi:ribA/ribD-fused uncharacterized protein
MLKRGQGSNVEGLLADTYPFKAKKEAGRNGSLTMSNDWDDVNLDVMLRCVRPKFLRDPGLKEKLLATGDRLLQEGLPAKDKFWGIGTDGKGRNELGKILMRVRQEL